MENMLTVAHIKSVVDFNLYMFIVNKDGVTLAQCPASQRSVLICMPPQHKVQNYFKT